MYKHTRAQLFELFLIQIKKDAHEKHLKDRRNTQTSKKNKTKKVQYRVKNEIFVLYDYYQPVRIIGSGAYAIVWYIHIYPCTHTLYIYVYIVKH